MTVYGSNIYETNDGYNFFHIEQEDKTPQLTLGGIENHVTHIFSHSCSNAVFNSNGTEAGGWEGHDGMDVGGMFGEADRNILYFLNDPYSYN